MTTPVRGKSLTTTPRGEAPVMAPPPIIPPAPPRTKAWRRFSRWQGINRHIHPWVWWCSVIAICLISIRVLIAAMAEWPAFRGYVIFFGVFWFTCIGMLPITAIARTGVNFTKEIFGHD